MVGISVRLKLFGYMLVFFTTLRGQEETYVHGLSSDIQMRWESLIDKMKLRFGHSNMEEIYLAEAKLRRRKPGESFRDLGQSVEDLYRRSYPSQPELVQENSIRSFLDACGESEEFRMFIRRTKPKTLQEAVSSDIQEECLRMNERNVIRLTGEIMYIQWKKIVMFMNRVQRRTIIQKVL
ncbi:unnamed protein product [Mytilus edulis]|uniref:Uncharacterized protein n=1 Tax=Mytilus edulis TaxID=6550 RepID=A0A8S3TX33_MYTED|nr:unnamed protein product [Mytilus edulis]